MKQLSLLLVMIFCELITNRAFAHKQHVHQYFVREGYNLLKLQLGNNDIPQMVNHVGWLEGYTGGGSWTTGLMAHGAWLEDVCDPVWEWSRTHAPPITGACPNVVTAICEAFDGCGLDPFVSSTHFWKVDNGDVLASDLEGTLNGPPCFGSYFKITVENAYQKFLLYTNGYWVINWKAPDFIRLVSPNGHTYRFERQFLEVPLNITFYYTSLPDLYKTRLITLYRTPGSNYRTYDETLGRYVEYQSIIYLSNEWRDGFVWEILGRMIHLLTDMSVPAHARCDIHGSNNGGIRHDAYEEWYGYQFQTWNAQTIYNQFGGPFNPGDYQDPLHFLMYTTAQLASYFGSNGPYNGDGNSVIGGNPQSVEITYLQPILSSLLTHIDGTDIRAMRDDPYTENIKSYIRDMTLPHTVRATAGLLYWFAVECELISTVIVKNDFNGGTVKVNNVDSPSGTTFGFLQGSTISSLRAFTQFHNNYWRIPNTWQKIRNNVVQETHYDSVWNNVLVDGNATYNATFRRLFNVTVTGAQFVEPGSGGAYKVNGTNVGSTWSGTFLEGTPTPITLEAVLPSGWVFLQWSDVNTQNPRNLTPTDNVDGLRAIMKMHRGSSLSTATQSNGQRKLMSDISTSTFDLVYSSAGEIWWTRYNSSGTVLVAEKRISGGVGNCGFPSMIKFSSKIYAVWQRYDVPSNQYKIEFAKYNGSTWTTPRIIGWATYSTSYNPAPVISVKPGDASFPYDWIEVIFNQSETVLAEVGSTSSGDNWGGQAIFTDNGNKRPSLAPLLTHDNGSTMALAADNDYSIYLRQIDWSSGPPPPVNPFAIPSSISKVQTGWWYGSEYVPGSYSYYAGTKKAHATHSSGNGRIFIAWQTYTGSNRVNIINKNILTGSYSSIFSIYPYGADDFSPVISALSNGDAIIMFNEYSPQYTSMVTVVRLYANGSAYYQPGVLSARDPQASTSQYSPTMVAGIYRSLTGPPYKIGKDGSQYLYKRGVALTVAEQEQTTVMLERYARMISAYDTLTGEYLHLQLSVPTMKSRQGQHYTVPFTQVNDTLLEWSPTNPWSSLGTQGFVVPQDADSLNVSIEFVSRAPRELQSFRTRGVSIKLLDVSKAAAVASLGHFQTNLDSLTLTFNVKAYIRPLRGKQLKLDVGENSVISQGTFVYGLHHLLRIPSSQQKIGVPQGETIVVNPFPSDCELSQNFPNPFNPATVIRYQVPDAMEVTIKVYDLLGREVATLVNEMKEAGYYEASFNVGTLASGVYLYKMTTGKYTAVKKLVVMK